jgi:hypothetical protein
MWKNDRRRKKIWLVAGSKLVMDPLFLCKKLFRTMGPVDVATGRVRVMQYLYQRDKNVSAAGSGLKFCIKALGLGFARRHRSLSLLNDARDIINFLHDAILPYRPLIVLARSFAIGKALQSTFNRSLDSTESDLAGDWAHRGNGKVCQIWTFTHPTLFYIISL